VYVQREEAQERGTQLSAQRICDKAYTKLMATGSVADVKRNGLPSTSRH
jgi:hypothetical protein